MKFQFSGFLIVLSLFFSIQLQAQLCTGSLGDPVVNIDFGSGSGRGGTLGSAITAYTYIASGKLDEGQYTIFNATTGLRDNAWHTTSDHTGNTNGYMMIVNASLLATEGIFYTKTVTNLCPGTTYEFSAWLMNVMTFTSVNPNVTFRVSTTAGTVLGTYNTGELPVTSSATWKQFGFYFTTGTETEVVITILNNSIGAIPGNDLALDDIIFRACGPTVTAAIANETTIDLEVCENEPKQITLLGSVASSSYTSVGYQWQRSTDNGVTWSDISGANSGSYTFTAGAAGTYKYRMATADSASISSTNCRVFSEEIVITVVLSPVAPEFQITQPSCELLTGSIEITSPTNALYSIDGVNFQTSTLFSGLSGGDYTVYAKSGNCISTGIVAHVNTLIAANTIPTVTVIQPVICTNPYGTITVTSPDTEYSFDDGMSWQSTAIKSDFLPGDYIVKTRNSTLCESPSITVSISIPPGYPPTPTVSVIQPDCFSSTGAITVSDVASEYSFDGGRTWSSSSSVNNLIPGIYQVVIKNTLGCVSLTANVVTLEAFVNTEPLPVATSAQRFCIQENKTLTDVSIVGTNIKWYDAAIGGNLLPETTLLTNTTYYASQTVVSCESERISITISIQDTAVPTGDAVQSFCTTQKATIDFLTASGTSISWYDTAVNGTVLEKTTALADGNTYYATQTINGCESPNRLAVTVAISTPTVIVTNVTASFCDDLNDGVEVIDLTSYKTAITLDTTTIIRFYTALSDAENQNEVGEINAPETYNLATAVTTLYARIDSNDKCYQVVNLKLNLFSEPLITIANEVALCENTNVVVDAGSGFDSYLWSTSETTQTITITQMGNYSVTVTKNKGAIICSATKNFAVNLSNTAVIRSVDVVDWTDNQNSITVNLSSSSLGDYEYSLDGVSYQDHPVFSSLESGVFTVYVRDKKGCGISTQEVYILNYPKFFTPNGDGYNDTWSIPLSQMEPNLKTKIFDRYGKFIVELNSLSTWDGTFNGHELPSADYWFVVNRADGKIHKGHFSIKR